MFGLFKKKEKEDQKNSKGLMARLREGLTKTRSGFTGRLDQLLFGKKEIDEDLLEDLEEVLFTSDLGVATTQELIRLVQEGRHAELMRRDGIYRRLVGAYAAEGSP